MRALVFLLVFVASAFGELDLNSKTRNFSVELLHHAVQDSKQNIIISPYVVWNLLMSMAYETLGETREQFSRVFSLTEERSKVVEELVKQRTSLLVDDGDLIQFTNSLLYDEQLNVYTESIRQLEDEFLFKTNRLRFDDPKNNFLSLGNSVMVMSNRYSLNVEWSKPFNVSHSAEGYLEDGSSNREIDVMYLKARLRFSNLESLHASVTELPYRGDRYCMLLLRPYKGYDVKQVLGNLREISLKDVFAKLQSDVDEFGLQEVEVKLPQIKIVDLHVNLNKPLSNMGLSDMFDEYSANFDSFGEDSIYVGEISQLVSIVITKSGTKVMSMTPASKGNVFPVPRGDLKDPFVFLFMEKSTATMLFGGIYSKVVDYVRT